MTAACISHNHTHTHTCIHTQIQAGRQAGKWTGMQAGREVQVGCPAVSQVVRGRWVVRVRLNTNWNLALRPGLIIKR